MESPTITWPERYRAAVVLTVDVDAESGVLWEFPDTASRLGIMAHQAYGIRAGLPRLLRLFARHDVRATFFVPGFTGETHPDAVRAIVAGGHEVGHHGYLHEVVSRLSPEEEGDVLERGCAALEHITGTRPRGYRAPMWELNYGTPELLAARGFVYDSSLMADDVPYRLAVSAAPTAGSLIEIPPHWSLDDGEQYAWLPWIWDTAPIESPAKVTEMWALDFAAVIDEGGCLVLTIHPCLSGRPGRAAAFERLLERILATPGVWVATAGEVAAHVAQLDLPAVVHVPPRLQQGDLPQPRPATGTAP